MRVSGSVDVIAKAIGAEPDDVTQCIADLNRLGRFASYDMDQTGRFQLELR